MGFFAMQFSKLCYKYNNKKPLYEDHLSIKAHNEENLSIFINAYIRIENFFL